MSSDVRERRSRLADDNAEVVRPASSFREPSPVREQEPDVAEPTGADVAIRVAGLSKCYQIYDAPRDRLKQFLAPRLQRLVGKNPKNYFREFWALKDISFTVHKGETVGIIGRNGSGKSTLLQIICGTTSPTGGSATTNGRVAALLELGSGFNPEFTGRENVYLNAAVHGLSREEVDERFENIVAFSDIGDFIEQPVKMYSSGMLVRLAFAVIAHVDADILIIDEALSVGDAVFVQKCNRFIRRFMDKGTLLFVSHSTQSVLEICDRVVWLNQGALVDDDAAKEVVRRYSAFIHQQINEDQAVSVKERAAPETGAPKSIGGESRKVLSAENNVKFQVEVFPFDFDSAYWGGGGASILDLEFLDDQGRKLTAVEGCGPVRIRVHCRASVDLGHVVVGINIRNRRGLELISENSYLACLDDPPPKIAAGEEFYAEFQFFLPYLPAGDYTLGAAIADGVPGSHVQHHRRDDALRFSVVTSHLVHGVFSMPVEICRICLKN